MQLADWLKSGTAKTVAAVARTTALLLYMYALLCVP